MAKTQTLSTRPAYELATGQVIYFDDLVEAIEMANYAFGNLTEAHWNFVTDGNGWGFASSGLGTHGLVFPTSSGWIERYKFEIEIDADVDQIKVEATCRFTGTDNGEVRITVGGAIATLNTFTAGATSTVSATLNTSSTGTGRQTVTIEINHTTGTANDCFMTHTRGEDLPVTSSLPDPVNE